MSRTGIDVEEIMKKFGEMDDEEKTKWYDKITALERSGKVLSQPVKDLKQSLEDAAQRVYKQIMVGERNLPVDESSWAGHYKGPEAGEEVSQEVEKKHFGDI